MWCVEKSDEIYHARTYSHKYIKREPNGHGGWRYWYPTDSGNYVNKSSGVGNNSSIRYSEYSKSGASKATSPRHVTAETNSGVNGSMQRITYFASKQNKPRQADKAGQIYREGQKEQYRNYLEIQIQKPKSKNEYPGWKVKNSPAVTEDMYKNASKNRDDLLRISKYGELDERQKGDLQWYTGIVNTEGRNMAAQKQQQDRMNALWASASTKKTPLKKIDDALKKTSGKVKNWLNGIFTTKVTITDYPSGKTISSKTKKGWKS